MNETVGMKNCLDMSGVKKRLVVPFISQELCKYIGWILSEVAYIKKGHKIWSETPKYFGDKPQTKLQNYFCGHTYVNMLCCDIYFPY